MIFLGVTVIQLFKSFELKLLPLKSFWRSTNFWEAARSQLGTTCEPSKLLLTNLEHSFEFDRIISNSDERGGQTAKYSIIAELDVHALGRLQTNPIKYILEYLLTPIYVHS